MTVIYSIIFTFLLIPSLVFAGCFSNVNPIIDEGVESECFKLGTHGCIGAIQIENYCDENYYINNVQNCVADFSTHDKLYFTDEQKKYYKEIAQSLIDDNRLIIPPKFSYDIYVPQEKTSIEPLLIRFHEQKSTQSNAVKLFCDINTLKNQNFTLNIDNDNQEYNIAGHYEYVERKYQKQNFIVSNLFIIFFIIILIYPTFWLLSHLINKRKNKNNN